MKVAIPVAALVAALAVALLVLRGPAAPADEAVALVPGEALAYVHLSTDEGRDDDERLLATLRKLPAFANLRGSVERLFGRAFDFERDVRPWLGDEVGIALLDSGGPAANVLTLLAVRDEPKAQGLLTRAAGASAGVEHRGVVVRRFGGVAVAFVERFMAVGQEAAVKAAIDRSKGAGRPLRRAGELPEARSLDAWIAPGGVRRVLRPQSGLLGALGRLLDSPALRGVALAVSAEEDGLRGHVRIARRTAPADRSFEPELIGRVPGDAAMYLGLGSLQDVAPLLSSAASLDLSTALDPLQGEVAFSVTPALPVPEVTLITRTRDEAATREDLGRLLGEIASRIQPGEGPGQVPSIETRRIAGAQASVLVLGPDAELLFAVAGGRVVVSTSAAGIERALDGGRSLRDAERLHTKLPDEAEALTFLDLAQLLSLGDQVGLAGSQALDAVRDDLRRIRTVSAMAQREGTDTTAELFFEIP